MFSLSALGPGLRTLSPPAAMEYLVKVGPRITRFFLGAATATIVFGLALLFAAFGTDTSTWPNGIGVGLGLGLIAYLFAFGYVAPTFRKLDRIAHQAMGSPQAGPPPAEFQSLLKRGNMGTVVIAVLLFGALIFMVGAGFGW